MAISAILLILPVISLGWSEQVKFDCPPLPPLKQSARSVYELRPQDIKVVMALGDSISAGFAMMGRQGLNLSRDAGEYRGLSFSMGMDEGAQTLPNFLRKYNPNLIGGSLGHHLVESCYNFLCPPGQYRPEQDVFNAAQSGAMITNLVSHEFNYLLEQLNNHEEVDMQNDWKLLTMYIGTNDICLGCSDKVPTLTADDYEKNMREVLEKVRQHIPKVFVNLVLMGNLSGRSIVVVPPLSWVKNELPNVTSPDPLLQERVWPRETRIYVLSLKSDYCQYTHRLVPVECFCVFAPGEEGNKTRIEVDLMAVAINQKMKKIAADYASNRYDDFAVVVQPFYSEVEITKFPLSYYSSVDCFHPSLLAHQGMARALWNNMITPASEKKTSFTLSDPVKCPTNTTLLYTN